MLELLEWNNDCFAVSLEDIESFTVEPIRIDLNNDRAIFRPTYKLGLVEWDFVQAQCGKVAALSFTKRYIQSMYASATIVVGKKGKGQSGELHHFR